MLEIFISVVGWTAMVLILGAYFLVTIGRLNGQSRAYQWLNIAGAIGFLLNSGWNHAWPSAALNFVWLGIGIYSVATRRTVAVA